MFNLFIQDKGYCKCYVIDERIAGHIDFSEKLELLRQYCFNAYAGRKITETELLEKHMFRMKDAEHSVFEQYIAFEGTFLKVELYCEKLQEGYLVKKILIDGMQQDAQTQEPAKEELPKELVEDQKQEIRQQMESADRFIAACYNIDRSLAFCQVEKIDSMKYRMLGTSREKGLFYCIDTMNGSVKVIDRMNDNRKEEMSVDTELEAILWLLGFKQEDIRLIKQKKDIMGHLVSIAGQCRDQKILKTIWLMNKKNLLDALSQNPAFEGMA